MLISKAVKLGIRQDDMVQITDGLKEGQRVVTDGSLRLPEQREGVVEAPEDTEKGKDSTKDSGK